MGVKLWDETIGVLVLWVWVSNVKVTIKDICQYELLLKPWSSRFTSSELHYIKENLSGGTQMMEGRFKYLQDYALFDDMKVLKNVLGDIPWRKFEIPMMSFSVRMTVKAPKTDRKTSNWSLQLKWWVIDDSSEDYTLSYKSLTFPSLGSN